MMALPYCLPFRKIKVEWDPVKRIRLNGIDQIVGGCVMKSGKKYYSRFFLHYVRALRMELGGRAMSPAVAALQPR